MSSSIKASEYYYLQPFAESKHPVAMDLCYLRNVELWSIGFRKAFGGNFELWLVSFLILMEVSPRNNQGLDIDDMSGDLPPRA